MRSRRIFISVLILSLFLCQSTAFSHSGGTDANGCHTNRKTGDYHCHGGAKTKTSNPSTSATVQSFSGSLEITPQQRTWQGKVLSVTDGDTITVLHNGNPEVIRLYGVDCPENSQAFSTQAKKFTSDQVFSKLVFVRTIEKDRYGRTVADITLLDGSNLSERIVQGGYGWWYEKYAPLNTKLQNFQSRARYLKMGLWTDANPIPPWEYRQNGNVQQGLTSVQFSAQNSEEKNLQVYRTKTGAKYHRAGCRSLSKSMIPITLEGAKNMGLGRCSICRP